jgi:hypothetical protein
MDLQQGTWGTDVETIYTAAAAVQDSAAGKGMSSGAERQQQQHQGLGEARSLASREPSLSLQQCRQKSAAAAAVAMQKGALPIRPPTAMHLLELRTSSYSLP